jgi:AcrR family transcriptional regulator
MQRAANRVTQNAHTPSAKRTARNKAKCAQSAGPGGRSGSSRSGQTYERGRVTRQAIVRAAESILIEHGHAKFTVQRVAAKIGISPGNLNYYFPTKASLLETLIIYTLAQYRHRVRAAGEAMNTGSREALGKVLLWLMEDARSDHTSRLFRELWAMAPHEPRIAKAMDRFYSRSVNAHLRRLEEASGSSRAGEDIEAIVYLMHVMSEGSTVIFGTLPQAQPLFDRVRSAAHRAIVHLLTQV